MEKKKSVLDMLKKQTFIGKFNFRPDNGFAWIDTNDNFAYMTKKLFEKEKFSVRWNIVKKMNPAKHISLMSPGKYKRVTKDNLEMARKKFTAVKFEITDMEVISHTEKSG